MIDRHEFLLAGRGTKEAMQREAAALRQTWRLVRILPYGWGRLGADPLFDDWSVWVHDKKQEATK